MPSVWPWHKCLGTSTGLSGVTWNLFRRCWALLVALFSRLWVSNEGWPHWQQQGGPPGSWACCVVSGGHAAPLVLNIRGLHGGTTGWLLVKSIRPFHQGSAVVPKLCCSAELTHRHSRFSPNPSLANFSKLFAHTASSPFPHLRKSLLLFSSRCLLPASPYMNWVTEQRCLWNLSHMGRVGVFYMWPL